ncbi:MAG: dTDP-4-dehydrorhamnose reductase [Lentisphaerota bacterium]
MKKLAIIGGNGMLGSDLRTAAAVSGWTVQIYDLPDFQITNAMQLEKALESCDCAVNCAAYTAVDKAESEPELCEAVNALAVGELGRIAAKTGKYVIHISTDFVFGDLTGSPQNETDLPNPLSVYGRTKLHGEQLLADSGCHCAIIRIEWTYGRHGSNFISKILALAAERESLQVISDQTGSPTATTDVARAILCFLDQKPEGLYHFAADGFASRHEVAEFIVRQAQLETRVFPCPSSAFPTPAARPGNSKFDCTKIDRVLDFKRPSWQDALADFISALKSQDKK